MALPQAITVADELLVEIHGVLGEIRDRLPAPKKKPADGTTEISEPAAKPAQPRARKAAEPKAG